MSKEKKLEKELKKELRRLVDDVIKKYNVAQQWDIGIKAFEECVNSSVDFSSESIRQIISPEAFMPFQDGYKSGYKNGYRRGYEKGYLDSLRASAKKSIIKILNSIDDKRKKLRPRPYQSFSRR